MDLGISRASKCPHRSSRDVGNWILMTTGSVSEAVRFQVMPGLPGLESSPGQVVLPEPDTFRSELGQCIGGRALSHDDLIQQRTAGTRGSTRPGLRWVTTWLLPVQRGCTSRRHHHHHHIIISNTSSTTTSVAFSVSMSIPASVAGGDRRCLTWCPRQLFSSRLCPISGTGQSLSRAR